MSPTVLSADDLAGARALEPLLNDAGGAEAGGYAHVTCLTHSPTDHLVLYSRPHAKLRGVREYLAVGAAPVPASDLYAVLLDAGYRMQWDSSCADHRRLASFDAPPCMTHTQNYWLVKYPYPLSWRDYVYERLSEEVPADGAGSPPKTYYLVTNASASGTMPETRKHVRVFDSRTEYCLRHAVTLDGTHYCQYVYYMLDDPRGNIPKSIINFITSRSLPRVLASLYDACRNRSDVLANA